MSVPKPLTLEDTSGDVNEILTQIKENFGFLPNFFGVMARSPETMKAFLPLATVIFKEGKLDPKFKELAFLKASSINGCAY